LAALTRLEAIDARVQKPKRLTRAPDIIAERLKIALAVIAFTDVTINGAAGAAEKKKKMIG